MHILGHESYVHVNGHPKQCVNPKLIHDHFIIWTKHSSGHATHCEPLACYVTSGKHTYARVGCMVIFFTSTLFSFYTMVCYASTMHDMLLMKVGLEHTLFLVFHSLPLQYETLFAQEAVTKVGVFFKNPGKPHLYANNAILF